MMMYGTIRTTGMVELVLLDYRYVINYTLLFVDAKWTLSRSGLLTSPTLTHSSTYVVKAGDRIAHIVPVLEIDFEIDFDFLEQIKSQKTILLALHGRGVFVAVEWTNLSSRRCRTRWNKPL